MLLGAPSLLKLRDTKGTDSVMGRRNDPEGCQMLI